MEPHTHVEHLLMISQSLKAMGGATYNSNPDAWRQQTRKYCGLEAKVTDPTTGKSQLMYIGDSFDDAWVRVSHRRNLRGISTDKSA